MFCLRNKLGLSLLCFFVWIHSASGYMVGPAEGLDVLAADSDIIFKGTVVSDATVLDPGFRPLQGFHVQETEFEIVCMIQGERSSGRLRFRHYDRDRASVGSMYQPQLYTFEHGRTYVVFADASEIGGSFQQTTLAHRGKDDQGVFLCADDSLVSDGDLHKVIWDELLALLNTDSVDDRIYAIRQLEEMSSGAAYRSTGDFERIDVLEVFTSLLTGADVAWLPTLIRAIGAESPYIHVRHNRYEGWLATVAEGTVPGIAKMDGYQTNTGGGVFIEELCDVANRSSIASTTRELAIRALGLVQDEKLLAHLDRWMRDSEPEVRASAAILWSDFPDAAVVALSQMARDPAPEVRAAVASALGFLQKVEIVGELERLLADSNIEVRRAASVSLLSFSLRHEAVRAIFQANILNKEFYPLFLNQLANEQPEAYLDELAKAVGSQARPQNWGGGQIPAYRGLRILYAYLQSLSVEATDSGRYDDCLDALENGYTSGSSEAVSIYAFYVQRGMQARAVAYRAKIMERTSYDMGVYFDKVDKHPSHYTTL